VPIIYFFFPETKGLELEDVDRLFAKEGSHVAMSMDVDVVRRISVGLNTADQEKVDQVSHLEETIDQKV
jgi:hypothetical protein